MADAEKEAAYYKSACLQRSKDKWPIPQFVPSRVRLVRTISGDWPIGHLTTASPGDYDCEANKYGAVSVRADNGELLGLRLDEFEVIEWRENVGVNAQ